MKFEVILSFSFVLCLAVLVAAAKVTDWCRAWASPLG